MAVVFYEGFDAYSIEAGWPSVADDKETEEINMASAADHGGHCCGIHHIWNFGGAESTDIVATEREMLLMAVEAKTPKYARLTGEEGGIGGCTCSSCRSQADGRKKEMERRGVTSQELVTHMFEVVLTNHQTKPRRLAMLKELGFQWKTAFRNDNSGNTCHVFHLVTGNGCVDTPPEGWEA
jgi:hypothetical protein